MRRVVIGGLALGGVVVGLSWWLDMDEMPLKRPASAPSLRPVAVGLSVAEPTLVYAPEPKSDDEVFVRTIRQVQAHCGFQGESRCVDGRCGHVVEMPDLDHVQGWAQILLDQPVFVASTLARDVGVPLAWSPCVQAMASLPPVVSVQLDADRELWCVGDVASCVELADEPGFAQPGARQLAF